MRKLVLLAAVGLLSGAAFGQSAGPSFKTLKLSDQFYCEGAFYGDFNKDGKLDVVSGPFWYEGPDFQTKHQVHEPKAYDPLGYSENFLTFAGDFNNDGWTDILYIGFPAKEAFWYQNPGANGSTWQKHLAFPSVGGESPMFEDIDGDKKPELLCVYQGQLGYAKPDAANPNKPWTWVGITPKPDDPKKGYQMFTHGHGLGDINGDGKTDYLEAGAWWEQPKELKEGQPWIRHAFHFADAAAQMLCYDIDGDGKNDIVSAWHCHLYGINWYKQVRAADGGISFEKHVIIGQKPEENPQGLRFSQAHAFDLADFNGDGLMDFVVGKRFWAHGPKGDVEPDAPAVVYWFELKRDPQKGVQFIGHLVDNNSGVGTQVAAKDLNGDGVPDVIVGNKKGTFISLSQGK